MEWIILICLIFVIGASQGSGVYAFDDVDAGLKSKEELRKLFPDDTEQEIQWMHEYELEWWSDN